MSRLKRTALVTALMAFAALVSTVQLVEADMPHVQSPVVTEEYYTMKVEHFLTTTGDYQTIVFEGMLSSCHICLSQYQTNSDMLNGPNRFR